jgi:hypothetical protein
VLRLVMVPGSACVCAMKKLRARCSGAKRARNLTQRVSSAGHFWLWSLQHSLGTNERPFGHCPQKRCSQWVNSAACRSVDAPPLLFSIHSHISDLHTLARLPFYC